MKIYIIPVCILFSFCLLCNGYSAYNVCVPVVSIMSRPSGKPTHADDIAVFSRFNRNMRGQMFTLSKECRNPLRCTQLLKGDSVEVIQKKGDWFLVRSCDQYIYVKGVKTYIEGWVPVYAIQYQGKNVHESLRDNKRFKKYQLKKSKNEVSLDDHAKVCEKITRKKIISFMRHAIGNRYVWGGRSVGKYKVRGDIVGPDCSGLVGLAYKNVGITIPRNAQSMRYEAAVVKHGIDLRAGDLIFFAHPDNKNNITHVVAYTGNDSVVESKVPNGVVETSCKKRFGRSIRDMHSGEKYMSPARTVYFGTFLK